MEQVLDAPSLHDRTGHRRGISVDRIPEESKLRRWRWACGAAALVAAATAFVLLTGMRPAYDAYGWLVWGRQAAHLHLNTDAAPSWKPLTFLFTFPYGLVLGRAALWLWMVTAVAAGFAAPVFAGRVAYRLSVRGTEHRRARALAAAIAAAGILGIEGYWHFLLIATADPMVVALCLAAIDAALSRRVGLGWLLLVLVCLGRPEAAPLVLVYAIWGWRTQPRLRPRLLAGLIALPVLWFGIPALTSHSWLIAGKVLGDSTQAIPGNKVAGVLRGFLSLYELPMKLAAVAALALALVQRERAWLAIAGAAVAWLAVEVALALHGWGIAPRYMFEPAALAVVLVGAAAGRVLSLPGPRPGTLRLCGALGLLVLLVAMVPAARMRARLVHNGIVLGQAWAKQIHRLHDVIATEGGARRLLACGEPVTPVAFQSILAWELDVNVSRVGWDPPASIASGSPVVLFQPTGSGWTVRAVNAPACSSLSAATPTG